jgi:hypothetical protein
MHCEGPPERPIGVSAASCSAPDGIEPLVHHPVGAEYARSIRSMKTTQEIVKSIDVRLRQLNLEISTLNAARSALDGRESQSPANVADRRRASPRTTSRFSRPSREKSAEVSREPAPRPRKRAQRTSRPRATPVPSPLSAERLESLLSANGGLSTSALAEQANGNRDQVLRLLRELEAVGRIRRTGQRRGARWHAITDEDRIRERAAELESRRKRAA